MEGIFREKLFGLPLWRYDHPGFWTDNPVALVAGNVVPWPLLLEGIFREKLFRLPLWRYDHPGFWTDNPVALVAGNVVPWPLLGGCTDSLTDRWTKPSTRTTPTRVGLEHQTSQ